MLDHFLKKARFLCGSTWHLLRHRPQGLVIILFAVLAALAVSIAGNIAENQISAWLTGGSFSWRALCIAAGLMLLSMVSGSAAWAFRQRFSSLTERTFFSGAEPSEVLILFVSYQNEIMSIPPPGQLQIGETVLPREDLLFDADLLHSSGLKFSWEMLLRGIHPHHHGRTLRRIYLVGSAAGGRPGGPGTHSLLPVCRAFLAPYVPDVLVIPWSVPCDFERMKGVQILLENLIDQDKRTHDSGDGCFCIDITGGQKPSSAAAVLTSLNRKTAVQYVQTSPPKECRRYEVSYHVPPAVEETASRH